MSNSVKPLERWTPKEKAWLESFLRHGSQARAVRDAGYDVDPLDFQLHASMGNEIANKPHIKAVIDQYRAELMERFAPSPENIIAELAKIAFVNIDDLYDTEGESPRLNLAKASRHALAALGGVQIKRRLIVDEESGEQVETVVEDVKISMLSKIQALELLGKAQRMWVDRVENSHDVDPVAMLQGARQRLAKLHEEKDE